MIGSMMGDEGRGDSPVLDLISVYEIVVHLLLLVFAFPILVFDKYIINLCQSTKRVRGKVLFLVLWVCAQNHKIK